MTDKPQHLAGVIGAHVERSLSPLIHTIWAHRENADARYVALKAEPGFDAFAQAADAAKAQGFRGVNITIPHKENALRYASEASADARLAGAANMLTFTSDGAIADNSDIYGFTQSLEPHLNEAKDNSIAVLLGAGGAGRGVAIALSQMGFSKIVIANRTRERAEKLCAELAPHLETCLEICRWEERDVALSGASVLVNATSLGMTGQGPLEIDLTALPASAIVADIVYTPLETPLLAAASARGLTTVDGLEMLMHQAIPGYKQWLGEDAVVDTELRAALTAKLKAAPRGMKIIGLTGSIGMGKSTALAMFADLGAHTWSADEAVHRLYAEGGAGVDPIGKAFPSTIVDSAVDRKALSAQVIGKPDAMKKLEAIIHPLVALDRQSFLEKASARGAQMIVLDIPLLFENHAEKQFDAIVVVSAPADVQRKRVLARPGMSEEKFEALLAKQTPDREKRARADYVIETDGPLDQTQKKIAEIVSVLKNVLA